MTTAGTGVVFGARRLGRAIASHLADSGWNVAAASRSPETITSLADERPEIVGHVADLGAIGAAGDVLRDTEGRFGAIDLVVNAIADPHVSSAALSREAKATRDLDSPLGDAIRPVHNVVEATLQTLRARGGGTFIQITGGLALRARRGTAVLAATGYATRALVEGSIAEARDDGVHVALLVIRGLIESDLTAGLLEGKPAGASMEAVDVVAAIEFLVAQTHARAWTHELTLTPPAAEWEE
jgi:NADP-dependent 3-hydroxy acid dehydrogenase YdfG